MTCLGISAMVMFILSLMLKMYKNSKKSIAILTSKRADIEDPEV